MEKEVQLMKEDLLKSNKLKLIVLTEDEDITPITTLIESSAIPMNEIQIYSYKGCSDIKTASILSDFIIKNSPSVKIAIHRDKDYFDEKEIDSVINKYRNVSYFFITEGTDIETTFINSKHVNFLYPEISIEKAEELIHSSIEGSFIKSREKYLNTLSNKSLEKREGHKAAENLAIVEKNLKENPRRYSHGKTVLNKLKINLQKEIQKNPNLYKPSPFISPQIFILAKNEIWPDGILDSEENKIIKNNLFEEQEEGILDIVASAEKDFNNVVDCVNSINKNIADIGVKFRIGARKITELTLKKGNPKPSKTKIIIDNIALDLSVFTDNLKKDTVVLNNKFSYIILYYSKLILMTKHKGEHHIYLNELEYLRESINLAIDGLTGMLSALKTVEALTTNFIKAKRDSINALEYLINTFYSFIILIDHID